ncbi:hypothetical protein AK812_SmicGene34908 [Symbiodinium microadriaticum]|uniref:Uncharacterized protein n=1 Tax=Symbiodinium microadriaticum TaxID=2951 RepID=A0A1Q9CMZ2_SYMMI|nr:hypothetical protein AK812_SmicGene34908 [Symbiodinium microadriaticum]
MGRRDKDAPAAVPKAMKDLVNETLQKYKVPEQVVPRKVATPVRSGSVPPVVTTPEAKAAGTPNPPASTPIPEPNCKKSKLEYRDRKDSFMSLKSLPKLPSFSSSTSNGPRHLDSQSTIDINLDALDLNRGSTRELERGLEEAKVGDKPPEAMETQVDAEYEEQMMGELEKQLYEEEGEDETQGAPPQQLPTPAPATIPMEVSPATPPQASPMEVSTPTDAKGPAPMNVCPQVAPSPEPKVPAVVQTAAADDRVIMLQRQLDDTQMMLKMLLSKVGSGPDQSTQGPPQEPMAAPPKASIPPAVAACPKVASPATSIPAAVAPGSVASAPAALEVPGGAAPQASVPENPAPGPKAAPPAASLQAAVTPEPKTSVPAAVAPDPKASLPAASVQEAVAPDPKASTAAVAPDPKATSVPKALPATSVQAVAPDPKASLPAAVAPDPKASLPAAVAPDPKAKATAKAPPPADEESPEEKALREEKDTPSALRKWWLRHLFRAKVWTSSNEEWMESSIVINARSKTAKRRRGKFVWKKYCDIVTENGEGTASAIKLHKMEVDPQCTGKHWMLHPDLPEREAETEESDSEEERIFEAAVLGGGGNPGSSNDVPDNKQPKEKEKEKKQPKGKSVAQTAKDHISKGALKIVDADSLLEQLIQSNVTQTYAAAMVKDMAEPIEVLKAAMAELQGNMGKVPDETLASSNDRVTQAFQNYDDKVDLGGKAPTDVQRLAKAGATGKNGVPGYLGKTPTRDVNGQPWDRLRFAATAEDEASDISCSQSAFKPYMLVTKGEEFCYFQTKAFNGRVVTSWLAHETRAAADSKNTERLHLAAAALFHLHDWYCKVETAGRYLSTTAVWQQLEPLNC